MKKLLLALLLAASLPIIAQCKILFRPSIGLASQINNTPIFTAINPSSNITINRDAPTEFLEKWFPPQLGFMMEYKHNKHHTIGIGLSEAGISSHLNISTFVPNTNNISTSSSGSSYASFKKWVLEYGYTFNLPDSKKDYNEITNRFVITLLMAVNNVNIGAEISSFGGTSVSSTSLDSVTIINDSTVSKGVILKNNFLQLTPSIRVAYKNQRGIEKFGLTVSYDYGFKNIISFNDDGYALGDIKKYTSTQTTNGNQWKVALSIPLNLYDFHKKEHTVGKWFR